MSCEFYFVVLKMGMDKMDLDDWDMQEIMYIAFGLFGGLIVFFSICCACCNRRRRRQSKTVISIHSNHSNQSSRRGQSNDEDGNVFILRFRLSIQSGIFVSVPK